jgi:hypothetical protein
VTAPTPVPEWGRTDAHGLPLLPPTLLTLHRTSPRDVGVAPLVLEVRPLDARA